MQHPRVRISRILVALVCLSTACTTTPATPTTTTPATPTTTTPATPTTTTPATPTTTTPATLPAGQGANLSFAAANVPSPPGLPEQVGIGIGGGDETGGCLSQSNPRIRLAFGVDEVGTSQVGWSPVFCFEGFNVLEPLDAKLQGPDGYSIVRHFKPGDAERPNVNETYDDLADPAYIWMHLNTPDMPLGDYVMTATQGTVSKWASYTLTASSSTSPDIRVTQPEVASTWMKTLRPQVQAGMPIQVFVSGYPPESPAAVHIYARPTDYSSEEVYVGTLMVTTDETGIGFASIPTMPSDAETFVCLLPDADILEAWSFELYPDGDGDLLTSDWCRYNLELVDRVRRFSHFYFDSATREPSPVPGWISMVASLSTDRATVNHAWDQAEALGDVRVLLSDDFASLNPGFWVLYSGWYETQEEADARCRDWSASECHSRPIND